MKPSPMKTVMIRTAIEKGIRDIRTDPKRGIRNLTELGEMFASGRFQRDFFDIALQQLRDENSAYFHIVDQIAQQTDTEALTTFGINLGYNALSHGASVIRDIEATEGFNVPWCLTFDLGYDHMLSPDDIANVIGEGKELGIYCYLIRFDETYSYLEEMLQVLIDESDCAFVVFCNHNCVSTTLCDALLRARNTLVLLDLDTSEEKELQTAVQRLKGTGNLCGGFSHSSQLAAQDITPHILEQAESLNLPLMAFVRIKKHHLLQTDSVYKAFIELRKNMDIPVLPIDVYDDMAFADQAISTEACLVAILGDGSLILNNVEMNEQTTGYNIREISLREALRRVMPKCKSSSRAVNL